MRISFRRWRQVQKKGTEQQMTKQRLSILDHLGTILIKSETVPIHDDPNLQKSLANTIDGDRIAWS